MPSRCSRAAIFVRSSEAGRRRSAISRSDRGAAGCPAYVGRGRAYSESGQLDKALADLNAAIAINVNVPTAFTPSGAAKLIAARARSIAPSRFSRAIAQGPKTDLAPYFVRAQLFSSKGDYTGALADLDVVLSAAPDNAAAKQLRQSTLAMQAELAKAQDKPQDKDKPKPAPSASPPAPDMVDQNAPPQAAQPGNSAGKQLIERARQLVTQAKYSDAVVLLNQVLAANPRDQAALQLRSAARSRLGQFAEARADLDELIKLRPNDVTTLAMRGTMSAAMRQPEQGLVDSEAALKINPNSAQALYSRGVINRQLKNVPAALADFDRAIAIDPKLSAAFYERGITHMSLNQLDKALTDFDQALALARVYDLAKAARGVVLLMKGNSAEGLADINAVLERNPSNQTAVVGRGMALITSGQFDRAIVALNSVVGKAADDTVARTLRARAYLGKGDLRNAMSDLDLILKAHPEDAVALTLRGNVWAAMRDYPKALKDLNEAVERKETIESLYARARVHEAQNDSQKAAADYRRATELVPRSVFETAAQANAKQKAQQLSKRIPCGSTGGSGTCL